MDNQKENEMARFEFEPTGEPDIPNGKGAHGRAQRYVDGDLVAETDMPLTTPIIFNPGGLTCAPVLAHR